MIQKENEGSDRRPSCFSGWRKLPRPSAGWRSPGRQVRHRPHPAHAQQHTGTLCHRAQPPGTGRGWADSSSALHWRAWPEGPRPPPPPTPRGPGACNLEQRPSIHVSNRCRGRHSEGTPGESEVPLPTSTQQCNKGVRCSDNTDKRKCRPWAVGVVRWPRCSVDSADCKGPGSLRDHPSRGTGKPCAARHGQRGLQGQDGVSAGESLTPDPSAGTQTAGDAELSCALLNSRLGLLKTNPLLPRYKPSQAS